MPIAAAQAHNVSYAYKDLIRAFDPSETAHPALWLEIQSRLYSYMCALQAPPITPTAYPTAATHPPIALPPDFAASKPPAKAHLVLCASAAGALSGITWSTTHETETFWRAIYNLLTLWGARHQTYGENLLTRSRPRAAEGLHIPAYQERQTLIQSDLRPARFLHAPWYVPGSFPHADPADPTQLRYRPKGKPVYKDLFVSAKPGKYLTARFSDALTTTQIADLAADHRAAFTPPPFLIARTAKEITRVYANGPTSCMAGAKTKCEKTSFVACYATPDTGVAYIERDGKITARSFVRLSTKQHSKIYGDSVQLTALLTANGFTSAHASSAATARFFSGLRLAAIRSTTHRPARKAQEDSGEPVLIAPYFDASQYGYYDPESDSLIPCPQNKIPPGRPTHAIAGGYTLQAIENAPAKIQPCPDYSDFRAMITIRGSSSGNTQMMETVSSMGRTEEVAAQLAGDAVAAKAALLLQPAAAPSTPSQNQYVGAGGDGQWIPITARARTIQGY